MLRLLGIGNDLLVEKIQTLYSGAPTDVSKVLAKRGGIYAKCAQTLSAKDYTHVTYSQQKPMNPLRTQQFMHSLLPRLLPMVHVEPEPSWFGSIAQVYRAFHQNTQEALVLKVLYAGVEEALRSDLALMESVAGLTAEQKYVAMVEDAREHLMEEVDLRNEARNLHMAAAVLRRFPHIAVDIPRVLPDFSGVKYLCMTQVHGEVMSSWMQSHAHDRAAVNALAAIVCSFVYTLMYNDLVYHDIHWANMIVRQENPQNSQNPQGGGLRLGVVDFGSLSVLPQDVREPRIRLHRSCMTRDRAAFLEACRELDILDAAMVAQAETSGQEKQVDLLFEYFCTQFRPFSTPAFKYTEEYSQELREVPLESLRLLKGRQYIYPMAKLSFMLNSFLCSLQAEGRFQQIVEDAIFTAAPGASSN